MRREILTILSSEGLQRGSAGSYSPAPCRGGDKGGYSLSSEREYPPLTPKRKGLIGSLGLDSLYASGMKCLRAAEPRLPLLYDLVCSYYPLPLCQSRGSTAKSPSTGAFHNAASVSNAAFGTQSAAVLTSLAPHDSKARLLDMSKRRDSWRSHVHRTRLRSACSYSSLRLPMCGVKGHGPLRSLGGPRGPFSHVREWPPYSVQRPRRCSPLQTARSLFHLA